MQNVFDKNTSRAIMRKAHKLARELRTKTPDTSYRKALSTALKQIHAEIKAFKAQAHDVWFSIMELFDNGYGKGMELTWDEKRTMANRVLELDPLADNAAKELAQIKFWQYVKENRQQIYIEELRAKRGA